VPVVTVTCCGESSAFVHTTGMFFSTVSFAGPNLKPSMVTRAAAGAAPKFDVGAAATSLVCEITKSDFSCGLWHSKQAL
jgi:hypothetical protein